MVPTSINRADHAGITPVEGLYPGRLAIEQLYGYMVRNHIAYGVLSTMKGWAFLQRRNGGQLYMTPFYGDFPAVPPTFPSSAAQDGYAIPTVPGIYPPIPFSMMQALYYISHLAESTNNLMETPANGQNGNVFLPMGGEDSRAAPVIQQPPAIAPAPLGYNPGGLGYGWGGGPGYPQYQVVGGYDDATDCFLYHEGVDYSSLIFEPWKEENNLGSKTWIATVVSDQTQVVLKLWDAWHFDAQDRDNEASIYLHLRSIWGRYVPALRVSSPIDFYHGLILQYFDVSSCLHMIY
jgi:hypothetical protein